MAPNAPNAASGSSQGKAGGKPFGHGSRESDVAEHIGAYAGEDKAAAEREQQRARMFKSSVDGEPDTIVDETVEQMRARVRRERETAEPTEFQRSLVGRRPNEMRAGLGAGTAGGIGGTAAGGSAGQTTAGDVVTGMGGGAAR